MNTFKLNLLVLASVYRWPVAPWRKRFQRRLQGRQAEDFGRLQGGQGRLRFARIEREGHLRGRGQRQ
ncbi:hypothetical protein [Candidatus Skiveiella danica]|uniref:hypothetical protein n=1 Tax=Candidatus Skiveiella danica TaxID=3386177 RepID=UPI0039B9A025